MRKRFHAVILLTFICLMCGCGDGKENENPLDEGGILTQTQQPAETGGETKGSIPSTELSIETAQNAENETKTVEVSEGSEAKDEIWFMPPNSNTDFNFGVDEYNYVFYFRGFYLSNNGEADQIYIDPVEFVWNWETERWLAWGNSVDDGPYCEQRNEKEEVISLPLAENTEFYVYNDNDPVLYEICERSNNRECMTRNPEIFLYYVQTQFDNCAEEYPFFMILNEDGTVKYVIEYPLV